MRVTPARRLARDERGAVLTMVALLLVVLIGMLVLTVDLGRSVAMKRQMVNGTDAAALAAAQQCALGKGSTAASSAATAVLRQNRGNASVTQFVAPECNNPVDQTPNLVTVVSSAEITYFFAGIFGFESGDVAARATAQWGPVALANPIPITVDQLQLANNCGIVAGSPPADPVENCNLSYPKDALQEPRWGVLDLAEWGDPNAAPCSVDANTLGDIIEDGGWPDPLPANNYDCLDNGLSFSVWAAMEGEVLTFPVIDIERSTGTVKPGGGETCTGADIPALKAAGKDCQIDTAYVVGFISLLVNSVVNNGSTVEVNTTYLGPSTGNGIPCAPDEDCADFGLRAIRLVE